IGSREIWVELNGSLVERNGLGWPLLPSDPDTHAEGLEGVQRGGGGFDGDIELRHGGEGFSELGTHGGGDLIEGLEDALLAGGFALLLGEDVAGVAVDGFETDDVLRAKAGDGPLEQGFGSGAETDFAGNVGGDFVARLAAHELHGFADAVVREDVEEWRLSEVDGQSLLERIIEDGLSGFVVKVGQDDGVFFCEERSIGRWNCRTRVPVEATGEQGGDDDHHSRNQNLPPVAHRWSRRRCLTRRKCRLLLVARRAGGRTGACDTRSGWRSGCVVNGGGNSRPARFCLPLQAFQVGTQISSVLVAQIAILLQRLAHDPF